MNYEVRDTRTGKSMGVFATRAHAEGRYRGAHYVVTQTDAPVNVWASTITL
jgi:hypothetical protein